ncbi:MAG: hypothetical protein WC291_02910 [Thermodesulfovibrionales bacterium]|jgi:hypothetical protein
MHTFKTLNEALAAHEYHGGILLVLDNGKYAVCDRCLPGRCGKCGRSEEWLDSLAPSWSEAAPENMRRDPRNKIAAAKGLKIAQVSLF